MSLIRSLISRSIYRRMFINSIWKTIKSIKM